MQAPRADDHSQQRFQWTNCLLFAALSIGVFLLLLTGKISAGRLEIKILFTVVFLACVYTVSTSRRYLILSVLMMAPGLISTWVSFFVRAKVLEGLSLAALAVFLIYSAALILRHVLFAGRRVTTDTIFGAINIYLLIGVTWTVFYMLAELCDPDAFRLSEASKSKEWAVETSERQPDKLTYFSFVTLTTLGYGDVTANSPVSRTLAIAEALTGQLYLTILVAALVGLRLQQSIARPAAGESAKRKE